MQWFVNVFFSEAAWRLIPSVTSLITGLGAVFAFQLFRIARRNHIRHLASPYRPAAVILQRRALGWFLALVLLVCAGTLFTIAWLPVPPTVGHFFAAWVNHYIVGGIGTILSVLAYLDYRDRVRLG